MTAGDRPDKIPPAPFVPKLVTYRRSCSKHAQSARTTPSRTPPSMWPTSRLPALTTAYGARSPSNHCLATSDLSTRPPCATRRACCGPQSRWCRAPLRSIDRRPVGCGSYLGAVISAPGEAGRGFAERHVRTESASGIAVVSSRTASGTDRSQSARLCLRQRSTSIYAASMSRSAEPFSGCAA